MRAERVWPAAIVGVLGVTVLVNVVLIRLAGAPNGAVVEPHYYQKAVTWDSTAARARASAALGWSVDVETSALDESGSAVVRFVVHDRAGRTVTGATAYVEAISNLDAVHHVTSVLSAQPDGSYAARVPLGRPGLWEYRLDVTRGADVFVRSLRCDVRRG